MSYNSPFTGNVVQPTDVSYRAVTLSANTQLAWPINGNATDDYAARIMEVTATAGGLSLYMPPANQTSVGNDAMIRNVGSNTSEESREMRSIDARLAHMDELEVDVQVLYPTLFLRAFTQDPATEIAICRSYNRWLADIWKQGKGRLRWVVAPPLRDLEETRKEIRFGSVVLEFDGDYESCMNVVVYGDFRTEWDDAEGLIDTLGLGDDNYDAVFIARADLMPCLDFRFCLSRDADEGSDEFLRRILAGVDAKEDELLALDEEGWKTMVSWAEAIKP